MPYDIKKIDGKYCVVKQGTTESKGCSATRGEAVDHMRALYAAEASVGSNIELNMDDVDGAIHHLKLAKKLHQGHISGVVPTSAASQEELMVHIEEALAALEGDEGTDVEDEAPEAHSPVPAGPEKAEYAEGLEEFPWKGPIVFENVTTGDNRVFKLNAINWEAESLPWAFRWQKHSGQGHAGSVPVGRVDRIERRDDGVLFGYGVVIPGLSEEAAEYLRLLETGAGGGVSVDGDSAQFEVQELAEGASGSPRIEFSAMRLRALSAVDIPAFNGARIKLYTPGVDEDDEVELADAEAVDVELCDTPEQDIIHLREELAKKKRNKKRTMKYGWKFDEALVAAAIPTVPSTEAFLEPNFEGPTALTVTPDGRVFGHLALFNTCHIGFPGTCVKPPKGSDYRYFHTGQVETAEGEFVDVGHLTFGTGHATMNGTPKAAAEHYDNTGSVAADVRAGEDEFGIWVVGALRPGLTDEDIRAFRAAPLSGDWRKIAGRLELVGALAVNIPGFPVPRVRALVASGDTEALQTFLEGDDEAFVSNYEMELRVNKKIALAGKIEELAGKLEVLEEEADATKVPSIDELADLKNPKAPSRKELEARAENYTPDQIKEDLKKLRELLDDDEETIAKNDRKKLEALYDYLIKNGLDKQPRTEAAAMELELFCNGYDMDEIQASGLDIAEFYNQCHDEGGRFCEGPDGPGRVRDKGGLKGRFAQPNQPGGGYQQNRPSGGGFNPGGGGGGQQNQGGDRSYAEQAKNAANDAGRKYVSSRRELLSASRWAAASTLAFGAYSAGISLAPVIGVLGGPAGLLAISLVGVAAAGSHIVKSAGYVGDARSSARKSRRLASAARQEQILKDRTAKNLS